ncbi:hypothetical protein BGZ70_003890, partial [Mortierella alpina]
YIVVFKEGTSDEEIEQAAKNVESQGGKVTHRYSAALLGFTAELPENTFTTMSTHPQVDYVEADGEVSIQ